MRTINKIYFTSLLIVSFTTTFAQWHQTTGPGGGPISALFVNGTNLYAGSQNGTIHLSEDNGQNWTNLGLICPDSPIREFATNGSGLYAACSGSGVFRSMDEGISWTPVGLAGQNVDALVVSGSTIYAGTDSSGVFLSSDNGVSWTSINTGLTDLFVYSLAVSGNNLFAGTLSGVYKSVIGVNNWIPASAGISGQAFYSLSAFDSYLFAGSGNGGGISLSTNNGTSWTPVNTGLSNGFGSNSFVAYSLAKIGDAIFAGTDGGVFLTTNMGANWTSVNAGLQTGLTGKIVYDLKSSGNAILASTYNGVSRSTNNGSNWTTANKGMSAQNVQSLAIKGNIVFAGTYNPNVFSSADNGTTWSAANPGLSYLGTFVGANMINAILVKNDVLFAGSGGGGVLKSIDNGANWITVNAGLDYHDVLSLTKNESYLYAGTSNGGVYRSPDDGGSWTAVNSGLPKNFLGDVITKIYAFTVIGDDLFIGTGKSNFNGAVYRSSDNGESWVKVSNGLNPQFDFTTLATLGNNLFAGSFAGVFVSANAGESWTTVVSGLSSTWVNSLATSGNNLFAGTYGGVFISSDNGNSWVEKNPGLTDLRVNALVASETHLFAGTFASSVFTAPIDQLITELTDAKSVSIEILIYPNPVTYNLHVDGIPGKAKIRFYNSLGYLTFETQTENNAILNLNKLPSGNYTVVVYQADHIKLSKKVIIFR